MEIGEFLDDDAPLADTAWSLGVQTEMPTLNLIAKRFVIDFFIGGVQREPFFLYAKSVSQPSRPPARFSVNDVIAANGDWAQVGQARGGTSIDVGREPRKRWG